MAKKINELHETALKPERALLVGLAEKGEDIAENMAELAELARTAGAVVVGEIVQHKDLPEKATLIGKGKVEEVKLFCGEHEVDVVIFDNELSGIQIKNLEDAVDRKILDRSTLILDIFAGRAVSAEGKLQVELAQMKYNLPRLVGREKNMAKMRMGIGMRGPGEKKLEIDRRRIRDEVHDLELKIKKLQAERDVRRKQRNESKLKKAALVGYTNSGKSTLMNALSKSSQLAENKLFATLDPLTRSVYLDDGRFYALTDTVGFINKLPHEFIDAFKSTLEEARYADILIHVVDTASRNLLRHYEVVMDVLKELKADNKTVITVYNKADLGLDFPMPVTENAVCISAKTGYNLDGLKELLAKFI